MEFSSELLGDNIIERKFGEHDIDMQKFGVFARWAFGSKNLQLALMEVRKVCDSMKGFVLNRPSYAVSSNGDLIFSVKVAKPASEKSMINLVMTSPYEYVRDAAQHQSQYKDNKLYGDAKDNESTELVVVSKPEVVNGKEFHVVGLDGYSGERTRISRCINFLVNDCIGAIAQEASACLGSHFITIDDCAKAVKDMAESLGGTAEVVVQGDISGGCTYYYDKATLPRDAVSEDEQATGMSKARVVINVNIPLDIKLEFGPTKETELLSMNHAYLMLRLLANRKGTWQSHYNVISALPGSMTRLTVNDKEYV